MRKLILMGAISIVLLASCKHASEKHSHPETSIHESHNEIVLSPEKAKAAGVEVSSIQPTTFRQVIQTSGQILTAQGNERVAVATVAGVVSFQGKVIEGMTVSAGSPLLTLSSGHMAEGDPVQKARVNYEVAQKECERMKALVENRIVSEKEFAQAKQIYENARISYEAVAKNQTANGQLVNAPTGGYVKSVWVKEGDYVQVGQPLVSITQNKKLFLRADVSERYYGELSGIVSANFKTPYDDQVYSLDDLNGRLLSYGKATDNNNGYYVPVTFEFDNRGDVVSGAFVEVYLLSRPLKDVIAVPHSALTEEQGLFFVYRRLDAECYEKQWVEIGADNGQLVQIRSGVKAGDRIVTRGAYQVKLAGTTGAIPAHTHEH